MIHQIRCAVVNRIQSNFDASRVLIVRHRSDNEVSGLMGTGAESSFAFDFEMEIEVE